jgi:hypothetical protein
VRIILLYVLVSATHVMLFLIFLLSGLTKLVDLRSFIDHVIEYKVIPKTLARIYGALIPFIELAASLMLLFDDFLDIGLTIIFFLLLSFLIAIRTVLNTKQSIQCSCFGRFFASEVDGFSHVKVIVLGIATLILLVYNFISDPIIIELKSIVFGIALMLIYMSFQIVWDKSKKSISQLKTIK